MQYLAVSRDRRDRRIRELIELARGAGVALRFESEPALQRLAGNDRHQGVVALAAAKRAIGLDELLALPVTAASLLLALDGIEDPQNAGAIIRSACGAGVNGVLLPARRAVGLTGTVQRVSAGALEYIPVAIVTNLDRALERAKAAGYWTVGLDERAPAALWEHDFRAATLLIVGAEGRGLHDLTRRRCDFLVSIPMHSGVASLNASAAAAVALFEIVRQRRRLSAPDQAAPGPPPEPSESLEIR
jgi:23S rRNA (guanosine2251-2'-O)-methyltransferase